MFRWNSSPTTAMLLGASHGAGLAPKVKGSPSRAVQGEALKFRWAGAGLGASLYTQTCREGLEACVKVLGCGLMRIVEMQQEINQSFGNICSQPFLSLPVTKSSKEREEMKGAELLSGVWTVSRMKDQAFPIMGSAAHSRSPL